MVIHEFDLSYEPVPEGFDLEQSITGLLSDLHGIESALQAGTAKEYYTNHTGGPGGTFDKSQATTMLTGQRDQLVQDLTTLGQENAVKATRAQAMHDYNEATRKR